MGPRILLWLGGMSGVGKTTGARAVARRYDLWLYSLDARTYAHAERLPPDERTLDELWVERTPEEMAEHFESQARERWPLVLEDLAAISDDGAPVLVDGPQLLPELVAGPALFIVASPALQRELVTARGSFTYSCTRDPERALANRLRRDELLAERLRPHAVEIADVSETESLLDAFVREHAGEWIARADRGDVAFRRCDENDRRLDQWQRYARAEPRARAGTIELACECDRPGCGETISVAFGATRPFIRAPAVEEDIAWPHVDGTPMPLHVAYYLTHDPPPDELVTSVRAVVLRGDEVLTMRNPDGVHAVPGGRREPRESFEETLHREVLEETGHAIGALRPLGIVHLRHLGPKPPDYEFPYPDFLQAVYVAHVSDEPVRERAYGDYELEARFEPVDAALGRVDLGSRVFVAAAARS